MLNNKNILNNLRDGLPYPYIKKDAEEYDPQERRYDIFQIF